MYQWSLMYIDSSNFSQESILTNIPFIQLQSNGGITYKVTQLIVPHYRTLN